ncbi:MAG: DUF669 domain-containing protein [Oscillospiraceae bacterium]|jgi:hypothetical protein|nr:DUF669 domain-containing protein [Oscillospiraceae bacterium]
MTENTGYELGWDDSIENDGPDFILLQPGDYDFTVVSYERARYEGGDKLPPCDKAVLNITIEAPEGVATIKHNLYLHTSVEGLLCAFFTAIGQRQHGERQKMNWPAVPGSKGRCKVGVRTYRNKNGDDATTNEIKRFYEPVKASASAAAPQGYTPGKW